MTGSYWGYLRYQVCEPPFCLKIIAKVFLDIFISDAGDQAHFCAVSSQIKQFVNSVSGPNFQSMCSFMDRVNPLNHVCWVELLSCLLHTYSIVLSSHNVSSWATRWSKLCKPRTARSLGQVSCLQSGSWGVVSTTLVNDSGYFTHEQAFTFTQSASPSHLGPGPRHGSPPTTCSARQDFRNPRWCSSTRWPGLENQEVLLSCAHLWVSMFWY